MPRDYWRWWWAGLALTFGVSRLAYYLDTPENFGIYSSLVMIAVWLGLILVGSKRNENSPRNLAYWWSVAAVVTYLAVGVAIAIIPDRDSVVTVSLAVLFGVTWTLGGIAVIILWLIAKSKMKPVETTRPCPYCAEQIQVAAIKCRFCSESVTP